MCGAGEPDRQASSSSSEEQLEAADLKELVQRVASDDAANVCLSSRSHCTRSYSRAPIYVIQFLPSIICSLVTFLRVAASFS